MPTAYLAADGFEAQLDVELGRAGVAVALRHGRLLVSEQPAVAAACLEAIRIFEDSPALHERLWSNTRRFKAELTRLGFDTGSSETPITPVIVGDSEAAIRFSDRLFESGVFATSVVYPTVALDRARLRTIVTAAHSDEQLDRALVAFARVGRELGVIAG